MKRVYFDQAEYLKQFLRELPGQKNLGDERRVSHELENEESLVAELFQRVHR